MHESEWFVQSDYIRDVVFPFFSVSPALDGIKADSFEGTGFLIGCRGFALTAGHVARRLRAGSTVAGFVTASTSWYGFSVLDVELHPTEDIAIVRLDSNPSGKPWRSWMHPCTRWEGASRNYGLWGYPEDIYHEVVIDGMAQGRPDLIFSQGHIRRRLSNIPLTSVRGDHFFELSAIAGGGCSGSPIVVWPPTAGVAWEVIGIYSGERFSPSSPNSASSPVSVGYAVRFDAVSEWVPELLGHSISGEEPFIPSQSFPHLDG